MENASHFIEQYRQINKDRIVNSPVNEISKLEASLNLTKICNCKTIAVFKIKLKNPPILVEGDEINGRTVLIISPTKN